VPALADKTSSGSQSVRDRLLQHAGNPCAAACHTLTDPIGLAFENFDAVGRFRTVDAGFLVDPSGKLKDGTSFRDAKELASILANDPRYPQCFTSKVFTYAVGRSPQDYDACTIEKLYTEFSQQGNHVADLFTSVAQSDAFTMRRGEGP
jgi:Protein of unknown function (DUF1585)/Protein of unknown function (DUF1588)